MASRRAINYQWRLFLPAIVSFWVVIISMASWQLYRVGEIKRKMVYDQLALVAERVATYLNQGENEDALSFIDFVDDYYRESKKYDELTIQVRNTDGQMLFSSGDYLNVDFDMTVGQDFYGIYKNPNHKLGDSLPSKYLYFVTCTEDGREVYAFLPYTKEVAMILSASTTRFWLIFFSIAIIVTIFVYVTTAYYGRNVRILRDFARQAAQSPDFVSPESFNFPHDEFGDISREILHIYNERMLEIEKREQEHRVALHAIEEKERIKRELSGNINHELKTPVGVIQGYIDTMVEDPDMDEKTRMRFLLKTQDNVHRLTKLIADITDITRLDKGGKLVNIGPVNFHDLVFTFNNFVHESDVLGKNMKFMFDVPLGCMVSGNDSLLSSVLLNLTKNAVAYSKGSFCKLEFVEDKGDFLHFRFYDDGVGVPPENLKHIFERFFRVNAGRSREMGGTGLGLSIVEVAIQAFGGTIEATNRYPSGLQFDFTLKKER